MVDSDEKKSPAEEKKSLAEEKKRKKDLADADKKKAKLETKNSLAEEKKKIKDDKKKKKADKKKKKFKGSIVKSNQGSDVGDETSVYGADFDDMTVKSVATNADNQSLATNTETRSLATNTEKQSLATNTESQSSKTLESESKNTIQVILLLMDPKSRRFELLQLEFDEDKSLVEDIITQIPLSATEDVLRAKNYTTICDRTGKPLDNKNTLASYCTGSEILVAVSDDMDASACHKLSKPILSESKVVDMLKASGVNMDEEQKPVASILEPEPSPEVITPEPEPEKSRDLEATTIPVVTSPPPETSSFSFFNLFFITSALALAYLFNIHNEITSPVSIGDTLSPGQSRNECGVIPVPFCVPAITLNMGLDGLLQVLNADGETIFSLTGSTCDEDVDSDECVPGALFKGDGDVIIGGMTTKPPKNKSQIPLSPWPFVEGVARSTGKKGVWF